MTPAPRFCFASLIGLLITFIILGAPAILGAIDILAMPTRVYR